MKVWKCCQTWQKTIWDRELIFFFTAQGENAGIALRELGRGAGFPPARELAEPAEEGGSTHVRAAPLPPPTIMHDSMARYMEIS